MSLSTLSAACALREVVKVRTEDSRGSTFRPLTETSKLRAALTARDGIDLHVTLFALWSHEGESTCLDSPVYWLGEQN